MNSEEASRIIAENFSIRTYEKLVNHFKRTGRKDTTIEQAKDLMQKCIEKLLETSCNFDFSRSDEVFMEGLISLAPLLGKLEKKKDRDENIDRMNDLCSDGYFYGYIAAARDIEKIMNDLDEPKEK